MDALNATELSLVGAALSSLIAALSYWAKTRHERRRATRTVLYYLLEVHHLLRRLRIAQRDLPSQLMAAIRKIIAERGGSISEADATEALGMSAPPLKEFARGRLESLAGEVREPFAKALSDLAREDPVLAFYLRGRDQLMLTGEEVDRFAAKSEQREPASAAASGGPANFDLVLSNLAVAELESALRRTAWSCDLLTHARVWLHLRRAERGETRQLEEFAEALVRKLASAPTA